MADETATLLDDMQALLQENLRLLREEMKDVDKFNERHSAQAQRLARSAAALEAERRKNRGDLEAAARETTQEQRAAIAETWLGKLPRDLLRPIVERLAAKLKERA